MRLKEAKIGFESASGRHTIVLQASGFSQPPPAIPSRENSLSASESENGVTVTLRTCPEEVGALWTLDVVSTQDVLLKSVELNWDFDCGAEDRVFMNGVQSWTDSREYRCDERMLGLPKLLAPLYSEHRLQSYGDYSFHKYTGKQGRFHGYTYGYVRHVNNTLALFASLSERSGYTVFDLDTKRASLRVSKDCEGMQLNGKRRLLDLFVAFGEEESLFDTYFALMGVQRPKAKPAVGWTSWYYHYTNISEEIILSNLRSFADRRILLDVFQIDDGYQCAVGDWLSINNKFPCGMAPLAYEIRRVGYTPGLWLAPFICEEKSEIRKNNPEWLLRNSDGNLVVAGNNDGWSGPFYVLDFYHPQVREYLTKVFRTVLDEWGFRMVKLDFLYAVALIPYGGKSRGEIMCEAMDFLRSVIGENLILGCGVPLGPSFGKVDYCRIGCDVGLGWDDKQPAMVHYRERISTITAISNSIGRRHLDGRAFWNDTDVYLLREENHSLSQNQCRTLFLSNLIFGNLLFTSDDISRYLDGENSSMQAYLLQFPMMERRVGRVSFQEDFYSWNERSSLGQLIFGEHPYANVVVVEFDVRTQSGEWRPHVAVFNLGGKNVSVKLPQGTWWRKVCVKGIETEISLAGFESCCLSGEPIREGVLSHIFPGAV